MTTIQVQGRELNEAALAEIRGLRAQYPHWSRWRLSRALAERWQWRNSLGQLKDMAARALLLKLQARSLIDLPVRRPAGGRRAAAPFQAELFPSAASPITEELSSLRPLQWQLVQTRSQRQCVQQLLARYHYRGYGGAVGENVQYLIGDVRGREVAVMVFGAAAWKVAARDQFIGWSPLQRMQRLAWLANQQRFLILPWVQVPHLASHVLAGATQRLCADWQARYGHPIWLVESFVEQQRFAGTSYKAAGWISVGQTTGRTRQDRHRTMGVAPKTVWLRALHPRFQSLLSAP